MRVRQLSPTNDMTFGKGSLNFIVDTPQGVAQCVQTSLGLLKGEWFLDTSVGLDLLGKIIGYKPASSYDGEIQRVILGTVGVSSITSYAYTLQNRQLSVNATIATIYDASSDGTPITATIPTF